MTMRLSNKAAFPFMVIFCLFMMIVFRNTIVYILFPLLLVGYLILWKYEDKFDERYNIRRFDGSYTNQTIIIAGLVFAPAIIITSLVYGIMHNNFLGYIGLAIAMIYPLIFMFWRMETFSDKNRPENRGLGYFPASYFLFSFGIGVFTTFSGFSALNFYLTTGNPPLEFAIVAIFLGLLFQTIVLLPDQFNKVSPIDLRETKGLIFMFIITVLLFVISQDIIRLFN